MGLVYRRSRRLTPRSRITYGTGGASISYRLICIESDDAWR
jgi:hypothetical protein